MSYFISVDVDMISYPDKSYPDKMSAELRVAEIISLGFGVQVDEKDTVYIPPHRIERVIMKEVKEDD